MRAYRKKPVIIQALQWDGSKEAFETLLKYSGEREITIASDDKDILCIKTLEGVMVAKKGDWIIKGVKGELYPCRNDIFQVTYEISQQIK